MSSTPPVFMQKPASAGHHDSGWIAAPLRRRTVAWGIDAFVVAFLAVVLSVLPTFALIDGDDPFNDTDGMLATITADSTDAALASTLVFVTLTVVVHALYNGLLTARGGPRNGQTLGKQWLKVRVVAVDGGALPAGLAWRRATTIAIVVFGIDVVGALIDLVLGTAPWATDATDLLGTGILAIVLVTALRSSIRQAFYDRSVGTAVVMPAVATQVVDPSTGQATAQPLPEPSVGGIRPRVRDEGTSVLVAFAVIALLANLATTLWPSLLD